MKKRFWFFLLVFSAYLSCPGYSAVKSIKVRNLPANQDMDMASKEYGAGEKTLEALDCPDCNDGLNDTAKCNKCVELQDACPDCCLTDDLDVVRCTEDESSDYKCKVVPFDENNCDPVVCGDKDTNDCVGKCINYKGYDTDSACYDEPETGGQPKSSTTPYGLQRRGCPEEDSGDLAPDGNCEKVKGTGLDRVWECAASNYRPKFSGCSPESGSGLSKPSEYYSVTTAVTSCTSGCTTNPCSYGGCGGSQVLACTKSGGQCSPSCSPYCSSSISSTDLSASATCTASGCGVSSSCYAACKTIKGNMWDSCEPQTCSSSCGQSSCESMSARWTDSPSTFYVYTISQDFKEYIQDCISYADTYEECADRINCCEKGACRDELNSEDKCNAGFEANCNEANCKKRVCLAYVSMCEAYTGSKTTKSCAQLASDANGCLVEHKKDCFKEIDEDFPYHDFVARSGESLTIIWQIVNKPPEEIVSGVNFYTLVKVWELDSSGATDGKLVHTSMMNVKSLEAAFSIYGTTHVPWEDLEIGKLYRAKVYYFLPNAKFCDTNCETCAAANEVELSYMSLIVLRVRE